MRKIRIGVLFGGKSGEHEVSLISARNILRLLDPRKYEIYPMGITKAGRLTGLRQTRAMLTGFDWGSLLGIGANSQALSAKECLLPMERGNGQIEKPKRQPRLDVVFPVLHGPFGEDGTVQGWLEMAGIPYVGSGVLGSVLGMDKVYMKQLFRDAGLPVVEHIWFFRKDWLAHPAVHRRKILKTIGLPCFVKPANLGSSIGVFKVKQPGDLQAAIRAAASYDRKIMVEKAVQGRELEISVLGNDDPLTSSVGEIIPGREYYDYEAKYFDPNSRGIVPAPLTKAQEKRIAEIARKAFLVLECHGLARVDFFLEKKSGRILLNEINTMPGFTPISMYPKLWEASGITRQELVDLLVELAFEWKMLSHRRIEPSASAS